MATNGIPSAWRGARRGGKRHQIIPTSVTWRDASGVVRRAIRAAGGDNGRYSPARRDVVKRGGGRMDTSAVSDGDGYQIRAPVSTACCDGQILLKSCYTASTAISTNRRTGDVGDIGDIESSAVPRAAGRDEDVGRTRWRNRCCRAVSIWSVRRHIDGRMGVPRWPNQTAKAGVLRKAVVQKRRNRRNKQAASAAGAINLAQMTAAQRLARRAKR